MGGTFADPAVHLGFAGPGEVFVEFPWLLPCLLSAVFNIGIFLIGYFFLDETLQREIRDTPANPHATEPLLPQSQNGDVPAGRTYGGTRSAGDPESPADMAHHDDGQQSSRKSQVAVLLSSAYISVQSISKHGQVPLTDILLFLDSTSPISFSLTNYFRYLQLLV
jgi:hypothetical protein